MSTPTAGHGDQGDRRAPEVLLPPGVWCSAGTEAAFDVTVVHRGTEPALLTLTVLGLDGRWVPQPAVIGPLDPGQSAQVTLTLVPERGALGARYPFVVAAEANTRKGDRPLMGVGESTLTVDARERLVVAIVPPQVTAVFRKRVELQVTNPGNVDRTLTLTSDDVGGAVLRLSAGSMVVPAGRTSAVRGKIKVRHPRMFGAGGVHAVGVTARDSGAPEHAGATVRARPLIRNGLRAGVILGLVLLLWVTAAVVFIPKLSDRFTAKNSTTSANTATSAAGPTGTGAAATGTGGETTGGTGTDGADGTDGTEPGSGGDGDGSGGTGVPGAGGGDAGHLAGTVTGPVSTGVTVKVESTSLANAAAAGATPADTGESGQGLRASLEPIGKVPAEALTAAPNDGCPAQQTLETGPDGSFTFGCLTSRGFYLVTFAHPGFGEQKFIVDAATLADAEPMQISLSPDNGKLSGTVTGPEGPVGAATVAITDGTLSLSTSTVSPGTQGKAGTWSMSGLSTPGTYLVTISAPGLGTVSMTKTLKAGGSATANATMKAGVATILGTVSGTDEFGVTGNQGGVTVSVTDGTLTRTATTVTTGSVGSYALPDLPSPGTYTLTVTGNGFQVATRQVEIPAGAGEARADVSLTRTNGTVAGTVTAAGGGGLRGVGLTLTGESASYKTISQSTPAGSFRFTGVTPGNYVLSGVLFGRVPTSVNVKVAAAGTTTVNLSMANDNLAAVVRNSDISVRVVDDRSGDALKCDRLPLGTSPPCTVTISGLVPTFPGTNDPKPEPVEVTDANTVVGYNWPKAKNLPAGLYQLTITAPGFEPARVSVQVQEGTTAPAPEVRLQPLGLVSGTVTTRVGTPTGGSCAVAYQLVTQAATAPRTCDIAECNARVDSGSVVSACAVVDRSTGTYAIPGLTHGGYQVRIIPTDPEYLPTEPVSVLLGFGDDATVNAVLDRLGRLTVTTLAPDLITAALRPAPDVGVELAPVDGARPALRPSGTSSANGTFTATGLRGVYRVSASGDQGNDSVISPAVGLNQTLAETLVLTEPIGPVVGQVSTTVDGKPILIRDATVTITGITGFSGATPVSGAARATTDPNGCFAVVQAGWAGQGSSLTSDECPNGVKASAIAVAQANDVDSSLVTRTVAVAVARADSRTEAFQATDVLVSEVTDANVRTLPAILVSAQPSAFGTHKLSASPSSAVVDTTTLTLTATRKPAGAGSVTLTMDTGSGGQLEFRDSTQPDVNRVVPGHYVFVANSRGFATANFTLDCDLGVPCVLTQQDEDDPDTSTKETIDDNVVMFQLPKIQGELSLSALPPNQDDNYIEGATVSVLTAPPAAGTTSVAVTRTDCVTGPPELCRTLLFRDSSQIVDGLAVPGDYLFSVSLAGFPQRQIPVTCGADYRSRCTPLSLLLDRFPKFGGVLELSSAALPDDTVADVGAVRVTVVAQPNPGATVAVAVSAPVGARSTLRWTDDSLPNGLVTPGRYTLQFSLPGFRTTTVTFTCPADAQQCIIYQEGSTETSIGEDETPGAVRPDGTVTPGLFVLEMLPIGGGQVTADYAPPGATSAPFASGTVTVNGPGGTGGLRVTLKDSGELVWNDSGIPIAGLIQPGHYNLTIKIPGYDDVTATADCTYASTCIPAFSGPAKRAPQFTGTAVLAGGATAPLATATFTVSGAGGSVTLTSDSDGRLTWKQEASWPANLIKPGTYQISASLEGFEADQQTYTCTATIPPAGTPPGCTVPLTVTFYKSGQFQISLQDPAGNGVTGAALTLSGNRITDVSTTLTSNPQTFGLMPTVPSATYRIQVAAPGFQPKTYTGTSAEVQCTHPPDLTVRTGLALQSGDFTVCTITLSPLGTIRALVASTITNNGVPTDSPLPGATVTVCLLASATATSCTAGADRFSGTSAADGTLAITGTVAKAGLVNGTWLVTASSPGRAEVSGTVAIDDAFHMVAAPPGAVNPLTIDPLTGRAQLSLKVNQVRLTIRPQSTFHVPVLPSGTYRLTGANGDWTCTVPAPSPPADPAQTCTIDTASFTLVLAGVNPGIYTLTATAPNPLNPAFLPASTSVEVLPATGDATSNQQLPLLLTMRTSKLSLVISRTVADSLPGSWTTGASVVVSTQNGTAPAKDINGNELRTGVNGAILAPSGANPTLTASVSFPDVEDGIYTVRITVPGYAPVSGPVQMLAQASPTPPDQQFALNRAARLVTMTLASSAAGSVTFDGASVTLHQVSVPDGAHVPVDADLAGGIVAGGVVSFAQVPSGTWQVRITGGQPGAPPAPPAGLAAASLGTVTVADTTFTDTAPVTATPIVGQGKVTFTLSWPNDACSTADLSTGTVTVRLTNGGAQVDVPLTVAASGTTYQATGSVLLPGRATAYAWTTTGLPTGWGNATGTVTVTVPGGAAAGSVPAVQATGTIDPATVPVTVNLDVAGTGAPAATATATRGTTTVTAPINGGTASLCLAPVTGWRISVASARILLSDKVTQTVSRAGPNEFDFAGATLTPSAVLAAVTGRTSDTRTAAVAVRQGTDVLWSDATVDLTGTTPWSGPSLVLPVTPERPSTSYTVTATPPATDAFGPASTTVNVAAAHTASLTLPYVKAMFTVAVTTSTGAPAGSASVSLDGGAARTANATGRVLYADLTPGPHSITATLGTTRTVSHTVLVGVSEFPVQLPAAAGGNGAAARSPQQQPGGAEETTSVPEPPATTSATARPTSPSTSDAVETTPTTPTTSREPATTTPAVPPTTATSATTPTTTSTAVTSQADPGQVEVTSSAGD